MSKWRKHVTAPQHVDAPQNGQHIVQALGSRGSNLIEVKSASGEQTLCLLPAKFNKKLWIKRGGFLIVALGDMDQAESVTGTIVRVLYEADIRRLKSMPNVWPAAFDEAAISHAETAASGVNLAPLGDALPAADYRSVQAGPSNQTASRLQTSGSDVSSSSDSDSDLDSDHSPIWENRNRPIREFEYTDDDTDSDDSE